MSRVHLRASAAELARPPMGDGVLTMSDALATWAARTPKAPAFRFLSLAGQPSEVSYRELDTWVEAVASELCGRLPPGARVLLLFQPGLEFIASFLACQRAGVIPVPVNPPRGRGRDARLPAVIEDCAPSLILSHGAMRRGREGVERQTAVLELEDIPLHSTSRPTRRAGTDLAFLQYTSGSTGTPKGVMVGHDNLEDNIRLLIRRFDIRRSSETVNWLPNYHDMGLVGAILTPVYVGITSNLMAPGDFLRKPLAWLEAISRYKADIAGGPNFAFELCARRLLDDAGALDPLGVDLSQWRVACVGAEPVRATTLRKFAAAAAPLGFRPDAFLPCYGLAESTLFVAGYHGTPGRATRRFDADALRRGLALPTGRPADGAEKAAELVACGQRGKKADMEVLIVDPETRSLVPDGAIGEICVFGPSVARGYWGRPEESQAVFRSRCDGLADRSVLRTGDLGFFHDDMLFIAGRRSDTIIVHGVNHYPQDLEETAAAVYPELVMWRTAAFGVQVAGETRVVVAQEVPRQSRGAIEAGPLVVAIRKALLEHHGVAAHDVVLIRPGKLPVTSSGKVRRRRCRELYETGEIQEIAWQPPERAAASPATARSDAADPGHPAVAVLRQAVADVLERPVEDIEPGLPMAALPLDSLKAVELQMSLQSRVQWDVPVELLQSSMSLAALAELAAAGVPPAHRPPGSLWADAALAPEIVPPEGTPDPRGDVLVTGATGFLGTRIVRELLGRSALGRIFCLVRGEGDESGRERLFRRLAGLGVPLWQAEQRVVALPGDLSAPWLGLSEGDHHELASRISRVFHSGARLDFTLDYEALKPSNVEGARAVLRFAATGCPKAITHVSSASVLETPVKHGRRLAEDEPLDFPETLAIGYAQSKWVADAMMLHARQRGFAVAVVRPPWIVAGEDDADEEPEGDFIARFLRGCAALGALPESPYRWNVVPVDFVARAVTTLALTPSGGEAVHHLGAATPLSGEVIARLMGGCGTAVEIVPAEAWRERFRAAVEQREDNPLAPLYTLFIGQNGAPAPADAYLDGRVPEMDSTRTLKRLRALGVAEPSPDPRRSVAVLVQQRPFMAAGRVTERC